MGEKTEHIRCLAEFIRNLTWEQVPEDVKELAVMRVLDLISVAVGAAGDPMIVKIGDMLEKREGTGNCSVWGWEKQFSPASAAMLNAMLAHTLELDDVHSASKTHGSASLIPAAWSCAQYLGKTGRDFLLAVICGYETVSRIGMAFKVAEHRKRGWHATATCGVFGCAAACGKLLDLSTEQLISALGMAGTQSSGVWAFLGDRSTCKVLHTGRAAVAGMDAAFLAQAGMTGPEHILDAEDGGLLKAMSDGGDISRVSEGLGQVYEIRNIDMKPYPCCRSAHCAIDCALELRKKILDVAESEGENSIKYQMEKIADEVKEIRIDTYLVGYQQCAVTEGCLHPQNSMEAKFSTPYAVAAAFLYGKVSMREFDPDIVTDTKIQQLLEKVHVFPTERFTEQYPEHWGCAMKVIMKDGEMWTKEVQDPLGSTAKPLTRERELNKATVFLSMAFGEDGKSAAEEILKLPLADKLPYFCSVKE